MFDPFAEKGYVAFFVQRKNFAAVDVSTDEQIDFGVTSRKVGCKAYDRFLETSKRMFDRFGSPVRSAPPLPEAHGGIGVDEVRKGPP